MRKNPKIGADLKKFIKTIEQELGFKLVDSTKSNEPIILKFSLPDKKLSEEKIVTILNHLRNEGAIFDYEIDDAYLHIMINDLGEYLKNPESKKCIFQTPDQMREFLNKHLKDKWSWRKNEIVVQTGQGTWAIARKVKDFFNIAGFGGAGSEMDNIGNVVVRAYVPKSIMALKDKE